MKNYIRTLNQNSKQLTFREGLLCVTKVVACQGWLCRETRHSPRPQSARPVRGNRLIVVAGVEARAILAVAAGSRGT